MPGDFYIYQPDVLSSTRYIRKRNFDCFAWHQSGKSKVRPFGRPIINFKHIQSIGRYYAEVFCKIKATIFSDCGFCHVWHRLLKTCPVRCTPCSRIIRIGIHVIVVNGAVIDHINDRMMDTPPLPDIPEPLIHIITQIIFT